MIFCSGCRLSWMDLALNGVPRTVLRFVGLLLLVLFTFSRTLACMYCRCLRFALGVGIRISLGRTE